MTETLKQVLSRDVDFVKLDLEEKWKFDSLCKEVIDRSIAKNDDELGLNFKTLMAMYSDGFIKFEVENGYSIFNQGKLVIHTICTDEEWHFQVWPDGTDNFDEMPGMFNTTPYDPPR